MIINLIGQPCSGKTTLSKSVRDKINRELPKYQVIIIDGDQLRKIKSNTDYTGTGRRINISYAYSIAESIITAGKQDENFRPIVILALISPFRDLREKLRAENDYLEVFLRSHREERKEFHAPDFEEPHKECISLNTSYLPVCVTTDLIFDCLLREKFLKFS